MKNGLAIWHYPHRTVLENVRFFAESGFESVSLLGGDMDRICMDERQSTQLSHIINEKNIILTVHHRLPQSHSEESVWIFKSSMDRIAAWQKKYRGVAVLSFDVPQDIRDNITPYIDYVMDTVPFSKIALEDFGLTKAERAQIAHLNSDERFGYLVDIGHMYIRICGKNSSGFTLFTNSPDECPAKEEPTFTEFLTALRSKEFPIYEIHLHNNDGVNDLHYFLDDGTLDINMIADVLKEIGFDGVLTIEAAPGTMFACVCSESDKRIVESRDIWENAIG